MSDPKSQAITLTADQLKEMLVTMAAEIRRPADPTPEQAAQKLTDQEARRSTAEMQFQIMRNRQAEQSACSHTRRDGSSSCVYVYPQASGATGNFVICQQCQAMIHPEPRPTGALAQETQSHIYDTRLFNIHYAKAQASATNF
jgi:hypothetical protein